MEILELAKTDLKRLATEVEAPEDALPCNLSDEWLESLSRDLEVVLEDEYDDEQTSECLTAPMYLIARICEYKEQKAGNTTGEFTLNMEQMLDYFIQYRLELSIESLNRANLMKTNAATLDTIFTDRRVHLYEVFPHTQKKGRPVPG